MIIDIANLRKVAAEGRLRPMLWRDGQFSSLVAALVPNAKSRDEALVYGWPLWLIDLCQYLHEHAELGSEWLWAMRLAEGVKAAKDRHADLTAGGEVFREIRRESILPLAYDAIRHPVMPWEHQMRSAILDGVESGDLIDAEDLGDAPYRAARLSDTRASWAIKAAVGGPEDVGARAVISAAPHRKDFGFHSIYRATVLALHGPEE